MRVNHYNPGTYSVLYPREGEFEAHEDDMERACFDNCVEAEKFFDEQPISKRGVWLIYHVAHGNDRTIKQKGHTNRHTADMLVLRHVPEGEPFVLEDASIQLYREGRAGNIFGHLRRIG